MFFIGRGINMSKERYQRGDWLMCTVIDENGEEIIVIQNAHPDGYTYTLGEPGLNAMSMLRDSRRTADPYLQEGWERLLRVEDMKFKEAD